MQQPQEPQVEYKFYRRLSEEEKVLLRKLERAVHRARKKAQKLVRDAEEKLLDASDELRDRYDLNQDFVFDTTRGTIVEAVPTGHPGLLPPSDSASTVGVRKASETVSGEE